MQNFMKTILSAVQTWTKGKIKDSTADWNQNDSSADNYVKNRTHWEENVEVSVMPELRVCSYPYINFDNDFDPEEGATYVVTFNGTRYELTAWYSEYWDWNVAGNRLYVDGVDDGSGVPFVFDGYGIAAPYGVYTVSVSTLVDGVETEVIEEQTLYNMWMWGLGEHALESGSIYSVNFDGNTYEFTATEDTDTSVVTIGDMTQYPFEMRCMDGILELYSMTAGIHNISLTNVTSGTQMIDGMYVGRCVWYNNIGISNLQEGQTYTVVWDDEVYSCVAKDIGDGSIYIGNPIYAYIDDWDNVPAKNTNEPFLIATYEPDNWSGIYFDYEKFCTVSVSTTETVVHRLDSKYLDIPTNLATTDDVQEVADKKMDRANPFGLGSFTMNSTGIIGECSSTFGYRNIASDPYSHAEGYGTVAGSEKRDAIVNSGVTGGSHAEGLFTIASGKASHAEGWCTIASGENSHAEGQVSSASGISSHAEGFNTKASGVRSHAEGNETTASGSYSHAEGSGTIAQMKSQHVQGEYNILDTTGSATTRGTYAHIVGNGTSIATRSNAHTLDWNGVGWFQGGLQVGGNAQDDGACYVPAVPTAQLGQTIVVKSVDENGKPTEWECVDAPKLDEDRVNELIDAKASQETINAMIDEKVNQLNINAMIDTKLAEIIDVSEVGM